MKPPRRLRRLCSVGLSATVLVAVREPVSGHAARVLDGDGTATIEGRVEVSRALTARRPRFRIYAEPGLGAIPPVADTTERDERRNIVVYIERVAAPASPTTEEAASLRQHGERFVPHVLPVVQGTTVDFPNDDPLFHNVFSLSRAKSFDLGRYPRGTSRSVTFDRSGVVQVFCHIHSDMSAVTLVLANPYFASPDADGHYSIPHLPPGDYTVVAWHERIHPIAHRLHVQSGQSAQVDFTIPLPPADAAHER